MSKKRGQFAYSSKVTNQTVKGYMAAKIRQNNKMLKPPQLINKSRRGK